MIRRLVPLAVLAAAALLLLAGAAAASTPHRWAVDSMSDATAQPGGRLEYEVTFANAGDEAMDGSQIEVLAALPPGLTLAQPPTAELQVFEFGLSIPCTRTDGSPLAGGESEFKCTTSAAVLNRQSFPSNRMKLLFTAAVAAEPGVQPGETLTSHFSVSGGGAAFASTVDPVRIAASTPPFGIDAFDGLAAKPGGSAFTQAAGRPDSLITNLAFNTYTNPLPFRGHFYPVESLRDALVASPAGLVGDPSVAERCTLLQLSHAEGSGSKPLCRPESQVGVATIRFWGKKTLPNAFGPVALYNLEPSPGEPARFGFSVLGNPVVLDASVRPDGRIVVGSHLANEYLGIDGTDVTFWNDPASSAHDSERACPNENPPSGGGPICPTTRPDAAFLRMPTSCTGAGQGMQWSVAADSWEHPGAFDRSGQPDLSDPAWKTASYASHEPPGFPASPADPSTPWGPTAEVGGCEDVHFEPAIAVRPTTNRADSPTGLDVDLTMPQQCFEAGHAEEICQADVKDSFVTQPVGTRVNPAAAAGLAGCSPAQVGLDDTAPPSCPDSSRIGTVEIESPLVPDTLEGGIFQAKQGENPFGATLAFYTVASADGVTIKLPAEVKTDPQTGQVTTVFRDNPQLPFTHYRLHFFGGSHAPLITPPTCGKFTTHSTFTGWANPDQPAQLEDSFEITEGAGGAPCPNGEGGRPFNPSFEAGTQNPLAGAFSSFVLKVGREDGSQELSGIETTLPPGLIGRLAGIPYCPEAAIAAAKAARGLGEQAAPACPPASLLGVSDATAGAGPTPFHNPGRVYLAGPYEGAPLSALIVTPAVAGPLDLGTVVVRAALHIDPTTTQVHVVSDPVPSLITEGGDGFPLDVRQVVVQMNRPGFTLNPTSCDPMAVTGHLTAVQGAVADVSSRFQVGGCDRLGFKPKLSLKLKGKTGRGADPALRATLKMPKGGANIARASVALPHSEFLDQAHIKTICTRVQYAAGGGGGAGCPAASVYGHATAWSPLLDQPLSGPVYLRSSSHELPDLVASLDGQIHVDLDGTIDSVNGGIRNRFELVPDAPVSKFVLTMGGGKKGLLENSTDICRATNRATARFGAQNGKTHDFRPVLKADCAKAAR